MRFKYFGVHYEEAVRPDLNWRMAPLREAIQAALQIRRPAIEAPFAKLNILLFHPERAAEYPRPSVALSIGQIRVAVDVAILNQPDDVRLREHLFELIKDGGRRTGEGLGWDAAPFLSLVADIRARGDDFGRIAVPRLTKYHRASGRRIDVFYEVEFRATRATAVVYDRDGRVLRCEVLTEVERAWPLGSVFDPRAAVFEGDYVVYRDRDATRKPLARLKFM